MPRLYLAGAVAMLACAQPASLIVKNARIWTGDVRQPWADSLAVSGDMITAVGKVEGQAERVIDAQGRLVTPGFIDSHVHLIEGGLRLRSVQLRDAKTREQFVDRIAKFAAGLEPGAWITGGDWDHENWGGELPTRGWIDAVTPKNPVWVSRLDGHMALANSLALKQAGVTRRTREVAGGNIVRDAQGEPTGLLKDNAMEIVANVVPIPSPAEKRKAAGAAMDYLLSHGVTTAHHMGTQADWEIFREIQANQELKLRIYAALPLADHRNLARICEAEGRGDRWLRWGLLKGFVDGSLGSHTAAFEEPYTDQPGDQGLLVTLPEALTADMITAFMLGLTTAIHAIGDRANRILLDSYERVAKVAGSGGQRGRIEHAQHLRPQDVERIARLGLVASMQPYHLIDDGRWADRVIGPKRAAYSYAFRSLLDAKVVVAFGSDWYVAPASVMEGIYAAVTRRTLDGRHPGGWVPEQKITVEEALRAYTYGGAYAGFEESYKGTLAAGKLADFVMLDRDITRIPPAEIRGVKVLMTVLGGRIAYESGVSRGSPARRPGE